MKTTSPQFSLDDLATAWLKRRLGVLAAMPGLNNTLGSLQVEADPVAFKHPVFPPFSAGDETTTITLLGRKNLAQLVPFVEVKWTAYQIERRCETGPWSFFSTTALVPGSPVAQVRLAVTNRTDQPRVLDLGFILSGRARNTGAEGYAWSVPTIPTSVFSFTSNEGLAQTIEVTAAGDTVMFTNDAGNAFTSFQFSPKPTAWTQGQKPTWTVPVEPGKSFVLVMTAAFTTSQADCASLVADFAKVSVPERARSFWTDLWSAAFTPGNQYFSGHLPVLKTPLVWLAKLYYNGVLTILTCRRQYPGSPTNPCYLTLWPRRGEGSGYLAWELPFTSGILARLDPQVLLELWTLAAEAPFLDYQVTNFFLGDHGGWKCSSHPHALVRGILNYQKWTGDQTWTTRKLVRKPKTVKGFEAASQGQVTAALVSQPVQHLTGLQAFLEAAKAGSNFGDRGAYLECITNYAYETAGHDALRVQALRHLSAFGEDHAAEANLQEKQILEHFDPGVGCFVCLHPHQKRVLAPNLYDLSLVLNALGYRLPQPMVEKMMEFVRQELVTQTWAHNLWPADVDVTSGIRVDHQWAGCFPAWISHFVMGALKCGAEDSWLESWLERVSLVTAQGPFGQAYWADDLYPTEAGGAAKVFDELTQGNHWVIGSGVHFAEMVLDGICGLSVDETGGLKLLPGMARVAAQVSLYNIRVGSVHYDVEKGRIV